MAQKITEDMLANWSKGPSQTETAKCENAARAVRNALAGCDALQGVPTRVFAQGSYRARTNVRQNSDVDICVCYAGDAFFMEYQGGTSDEMLGHNNEPEITFSDFKDKVGEALSAHFGAKGVTRGGKAFTVHENTYRIDADVLPAFEYRCYWGTFVNGAWTYESGIGFLPDDDIRVANWPEQTYANGVERNVATSRCYKRSIRILKRLRDKMQADGIAAADNVASFLIECLVWNAPLEGFGLDTYMAQTRFVLANVFNDTRSDDLCSAWHEVNNLKSLFNVAQPWTRETAHAFVSAAWDYIGFE